MREASQARSHMASHQQHNGQHVIMTTQIHQPTEFDLGYNDVNDSAMQVFAVVIQNAAAGSTITKDARA